MADSNPSKEPVGKGPVKPVLFFLFLLVSAYFLYIFRREIGSVFVPFALAALFSYFLTPPVELMEKKRVPRFLAIILVYLVLAGLFFLASFQFVPALLDDVQQFVERMPEIARWVQQFIDGLESDYRRFNLPPAVRAVIEGNIQSLQDSLQNQLNRSSEYIINAFTHLFTLILTPVLAFYILLDQERLKERAITLVPLRWRTRALEALVEIDELVKAYVRGIFINSAAVGLLIYLGLLWIGVDFPLLLGLLNGFTNLIPLIGPFIGAAPAIIVALLQAPVQALKVVLLIVIVQQIESHLIAPQVLGRSLGFHPLLIIFLLLLAGKIAGLWGILLVLPLTKIAVILAKRAWPFSRL